MGKLEIIFRLGLAHPLLLPYGIPEIPVRITFPETGNKVWIEPPRPGPWPEGALSYGAFDNLILHVERECEEREAEHITYADIERMGINRDAAEAFWRLFETIRDLEFVRNKFVAGYPVVQAEHLQSNPLVRKSEANLSYEGRQISTLPLGGIASIGIFPDSWEEVVKKLAQDQGIPSYRSYALDAIYFGTSGDPVRAVIMACAAWETALRTYLSTVAAKKSPAYEVAATTVRGIAQLCRFAEAAKGQPLFHDERDEIKIAGRKLVQELPGVRNKLLHTGKRDLPRGKARDYSIAVLNAVDWLFR